MKNSMKQANDKNQEWKDARDVNKVFVEWAESEFCRNNPDNHFWSPKEVKDFAKFFAQRCGVVLDGNSEIQNNHKCDHPYHSVVGGNGSPERCLTCGKVLSI